MPLGNAGGESALCVAIPFLRAGDVLAFAPAREVPKEPGDGSYVMPRPGEPSPIDEDRDPLIEGMRVLHEQLFAAARAQRRPGQAMLAMAHGYLVGGMLSELSERKVLGGNQHALPVDLFPDDCDYVALGHLHRPQPVAGADHIRYSGSPIALSMPERVHAHHVVFADLHAGRLEKVWSLRVPRLIEMLRIPERGECDPDAAFAAVEELPPRDADTDEDMRPLLEVAIRLAEPAPSIGERIATLCAEKNVRLARVEVVTTGSRTAEPGGEQPPQRELTSLAPEELFRLRYAREHTGDVPEPLLAAFRELLDDVEHDGGAS